MLYKLEEDGSVEILMIHEEYPDDAVKIINKKNEKTGKYTIEIDPSLIRRKGRYVISLIVNGKVKETKRLLVE